MASNYSWEDWMLGIPLFNEVEREAQDLWGDGGAIVTGKPLPQQQSAIGQGIQRGGQAVAAAVPNAVGLFGSTALLALGAGIIIIAVLAGED